MQEFYQLPSARRLQKSDTFLSFYTHLPHLNVMVGFKRFATRYRKKYILCDVLLNKVRSRSLCTWENRDNFRLLGQFIRFLDQNDQALKPSNFSSRARGVQIRQRIVVEKRTKQLQSLSSS